MIVYRPQDHVVSTAEAFGAVWRDLREIEALVTPSVEYAQDLLIRFGEFEAAVVDALSPERDEDSAEARALRRASVACGRLFCRALRHQPSGGLIRECSRAFAALSALSLPPQVIASVPEGYAYYGLFPQTYVTAAEQCLRDLGPSEVVVIGIRGIGASLASVVAGCLEERGCHVRSYTVRPHGHPFDRVVRIGDHLRAEWGMHNPLCSPSWMRGRVSADHRLPQLPNSSPPSAFARTALCCFRVGARIRPHS